MPTFCVQCAMKALVAGAEPPLFDETAEEHQLRVHPDRDAALAERAELEAAVRKIIPKEYIP